MQKSEGESESEILKVGVWKMQSLETCSRKSTCKELFPAEIPLCRASSQAAGT